MPEKLKAVTLGHWIATWAFLINLLAFAGAYLADQRRESASRERDKLVLEALAVKVTETKLSLDEHVNRDDARWVREDVKISALQAIVNDHTAKLYYLERERERRVTP